MVAVAKWESAMRIDEFRRRMLAGEYLAGTFQKTPSHDVVEVLAKSGLDFVCLDAEHAPFDRARLDACLAVARALDFPALVRVGAFTPQDILQAIDCGAVGVVVPHVDSVEKARAVARAARFGHGGRGYAGSSRWAGFATRTMPDLLEQSRSETVVIAQIEEPEGVEAAAGIAAVEGIDGLFVGPSDLTVAYGNTAPGSDEVLEALASVGQAARAQGKAYVSWVANPAQAKDWAGYGLTVFVLASEHAWMLAGARAAADGIHGLSD